MQKRTTQSVAEKRAAIDAHTSRIGIDHAYISILVDSFYERVNADETLGPIFAVRIDDWAVHLPKMKRFWGAVVLNTGAYSGRPVPAHVKLHEVEAQHFTLWLALFRKTLEDTAPSREAVAYFMTRAERIASSLQAVMFGDKSRP